jgi:hypothetical protein
MVWLDANIDESNDFYQDAIAQFRTIVDNVSIFTDFYQCVDYITNIVQEKVYMIISESFCGQVV